MLVAYTASNNFKDVEGILGLSFPILAKNPNPTFIQTLMKNKYIDKHAFGVNLNFQNSSRCFITFGVADPELFSGDLIMAKIQSKIFYIINTQGMTIGSGNAMKISSAILDTGNSCISIPSAHEETILNSFNIPDSTNKCFFKNEASTPKFSLLRCRVGNFSNLPQLKINIEDGV